MLRCSEARRTASKNVSHCFISGVFSHCLRCSPSSDRVSPRLFSGTVRLIFLAAQLRAPKHSSINFRRRRSGRVTMYTPSTVHWLGVMGEVPPVSRLLNVTSDCTVGSGGRSFAPEGRSPPCQTASVVSRRGRVSASSVAGESTSSSFASRTYTARGGGYCSGRMQKCSKDQCFKNGPIREVVEEVMGTTGPVFDITKNESRGRMWISFCRQKKESIDIVRIMPQERGQIGAVEQAVDAPTRQTQVEKAEVVRRMPRVCTSERIVEQTVEFLVSCQERTHHLVRPQAYVNRRR